MNYSSGQESVQTHHIHYPKGYDSRELMKQVAREASDTLDEVEPGQYLGAFPFNYQNNYDKTP